MYNGNHILYESKVYNSLVKTSNLGNGTTAGGGSPCTSAGNVVAFGCTEECLIATIFGVKQRGQPGQHAFVHSTGEGCVKAKQVHYHDALFVKQITVIALALVTAEPFVCWGTHAHWEPYHRCTC